MLGNIASNSFIEGALHKRADQLVARVRFMKDAGTQSFPCMANRDRTIGEGAALRASGNMIENVPDLMRLEYACSQCEEFISGHVRLLHLTG